MDSTGLPIRDVAFEELGVRLGQLRLGHPASDEAMRRSLEQHGQLTAATAFLDGGQLQLADGFKRLRAGRRLGWSTLRVRALDFEEPIVLAAISALNRQRGLTELEDGWIVRALCREHGLSQGAVAHLLRRDKSWVSRRLLLVEGLLAEVQGDVRLGLLSARSAQAVAVLPRGNQRRAADLIIERGFTTRQAEALVRQLCGLDSDHARDALMATWPESTPEPQRGHRPRSEHQQLLSDVSQMVRTGVRLEVRLRRGIGGAPELGVIRTALLELASQLGTLSKTIDSALTAQGESDATLAKP